MDVSAASGNDAAQEVQRAVVVVRFKGRCPAANQIPWSPIYRKQVMPFAITFVDDPGTDREKKSRIRSTHIDYVNRNVDRIIASGGLFPDDDDFPNGGLILLDVENRKDAVAYIENDPFFLNGIFTTYTIRRWRKFIFDYKRVSG